MKLEHRTQPLLPPVAFLRRVARYGAAASLVIGAALGAGMIGYRAFEGMPWLDAFLNAAMILGGMGPVNELHTPGGKFFAGMYALFSGIIFIVVAGLLVAPVFHRFLHRFHLEADELSPRAPQRKTK